ncbi:unnamed protein product [Rangifer tarandus platyrhynchus]|uniref:Uncharacterized protein n=1 Tax=Rangifer tarandus platyrhynchus TaxID=3082113 RepID=A0AC59YBR8_RANTA
MGAPPPLLTNPGVHRGAHSLAHGHSRWRRQAWNQDPSHPTRKAIPQSRAIWVHLGESSLRERARSQCVCALQTGCFPGDGPQLGLHTPALSLPHAGQFPGVPVQRFLNVPWLEHSP